MRWSGFRRVRRQVWRRIGQRLAELHLPDPDAYRTYLESHPDEWVVLDSFCRIPISRFLRDAPVFDRLAMDVLPALAAAALDRGEGRLRAWSAGCAAGEEPYSLRLLWRFRLRDRFPQVVFEVVATDIDEPLLARARAARYRSSSLREVPRTWIDAAFVRYGEWFELRPEFRVGVEFRRSDMRHEAPAGPFDLLLCRNVACTYFADADARHAIERALAVVREGGAVVIGLTERPPAGVCGLAAWATELGIFRRTSVVAKGPLAPAALATCA
jgi:chemotaxis protein methyltransferase CheR